MRCSLLFVALGACTSFGSAGAPLPNDGGAPNARESGVTPSDAGRSPDVVTGDRTDGAAPFCAGTFFLCDDFERADLLSGSPWAGIVNQDKGPDQDPAIGSPPAPFDRQAVRFSLGVKGGSTNHRYINTQNAMLNGATVLGAELEFLPDAPARQIDLVTVVLVVGDGPNPQAQYVTAAYNDDGTVGASAILRLAPGTFDQLDRSPVVPLRSWQRVAMTVRIGGAGQPSHVVATLNGAPWIDADISSVGPKPIDRFSISLGPDYALDTNDPADRWIDNVKVTVGN